MWELLSILHTVSAEALPNRSEVRQNSHKVLNTNSEDRRHSLREGEAHFKLKFVQVLDIWIVSEDSVDNPVTERVDTQLRDVEDILPVEVPLGSPAQLDEPVVEPANLSEGEPRLITAVLC